MIRRATSRARYGSSSRSWSPTRIRSAEDVDRALRVELGERPVDAGELVVAEVDPGGVDLSPCELAVAWRRGDDRELVTAAVAALAGAEAAHE